MPCDRVGGINWDLQTDFEEAHQLRAQLPTQSRICGVASCPGTNSVLAIIRAQSPLVSRDCSRNPDHRIAGLDEMVYSPPGQAVTPPVR